MKITYLSNGPSLVLHVKLGIRPLFENIPYEIHLLTTSRLDLLDRLEVIELIVVVALKSRQKSRLRNVWTSLQVVRILTSFLNSSSELALGNSSNDWSSCGIGIILANFHLLKTSLS